MIIAPGETPDRQWWIGDYFTWDVMFVRTTPTPPPNWSGADSEISIFDDEHGSARLHWYELPGWRIPLPFYVDARLAGCLPRGYVLPGSISGERLESEPTTAWWPR